MAATVPEFTSRLLQAWLRTLRLGGVRLKKARQSIYTRKEGIGRREGHYISEPTYEEW